MKILLIEIKNDLEGLVLEHNDFKNSCHSFGLPCRHIWRARTGCGCSLLTHAPRPARVFARNGVHRLQVENHLQLEAKEQDISSHRPRYDKYTIWNIVYSIYACINFWKTFVLDGRTGWTYVGTYKRRMWVIEEVLVSKVTLNLCVLNISWFTDNRIIYLNRWIC